MAEPMTQEWLDLVDEDIVDPEQSIVDPHHHLWPAGSGLPYGLAELTADTTSGHRIERTVFVECHAAYCTDGPAHLAPVGETEFVAGEALRDPSRLIGGIVAHTDLTDGGRLDEVLGAHEVAGRGLFRGIRHAGSHALQPEVLRIPGRAPAGLYASPAFRAGVAELGARGLTYDTWHYHYQNRDFADLARAVPFTTMVLDHFGTPLGVGQFAGKRDEIFQLWKADIAERPPTSDEFVAAQAPYYLHAIECFGPDRCMFESNFPVDRLSLSYKILWNALKKIAAPFSPIERDTMFRGTATRVYRLES